MSSLSSARPKSKKLVVSSIYAENQHENYFLTVQPLLHNISPRLEYALLAQHKIDHADLFMWATISGHFELGKMFWKSTTHPLAMAMLGAYTCKYVSKRVYVGQAEYKAQAKVMEEWVVKTLDTIPDLGGQTIAHELLNRELTVKDMYDGAYTLLDLAMLLGMKQVIAQRYSETLIQALWRGGTNLPILLHPWKNQKRVLYLS